MIINKFSIHCPKHIDCLTTEELKTLLVIGSPAEKEKAKEVLHSRDLPKVRTYVTVKEGEINPHRAGLNWSYPRIYNSPPRSVNRR